MTRIAYSITEAADLLGLDYHVVFREVRAGRIAAGKIGKQWRISRGELDRILTGSGVTGGAPKRRYRKIRLVSSASA